MSAVLRVENLSYKDILNNVSFEVEKNSFNVLVGPNSCGKTTLIKCLSGILEGNGNIFLNNFIISNKKIDISVKSDLGFVIDIPFVLGGTVLDNLIYSLMNIGYDEIESKKKIYSISDKLDLGFLLVKKVNELNYSEKKLSYFLRGIIHEPTVIIIDDIFDSVNSFYKEKIFRYLKKLKNRTIIFMTSNEKNILYADNVIIMKKGKIVEQAPLNDVINDERKLVKNGLRLPMVADLSHKLKAYGLINEITLEIDKMVDEIWE
ncbi:MAG: ATP-binding cassette domain-containing protein [Bacilli bacterium]|nr:ATP-binding cassette domain-containing protein [Bacilli bacterium]